MTHVIDEIKDKIMFYPWIGKNYSNGGIFNKKILILGESGYCEEQCECCYPGEINKCNDWIIRIINYQISVSGKKQSIHTKLVKLFLGKQTITIDDKIQFWDSVVYYNYVQSALEKARVSPNINYWKEAEEPFKAIIDKLSPDFILILGERLWENLPGKAGIDWPDGPIIKYGNILERTWYYKATKKNILSFYIYHPSSNLFSYDYMPIIQKAIELS